MRFWIDTEFNGYHGELLSIALVDENGKEWYEVIEYENFEMDCWVLDNVIPVLNKKPIKYEKMQESLIIFLHQYESSHIIADWPDDIKYFCKVLCSSPGRTIMVRPFISMEINRQLNSEQSLILHNALEDAKAIRKMDLDAQTRRYKSITDR